MAGAQEKALYCTCVRFAEKEVLLILFDIILSHLRFGRGEETLLCGGEGDGSPSGCKIILEFFVLLMLPMRLFFGAEIHNSSLVGSW
jgi:hypothetical protein